MLDRTADFRLLTGVTKPSGGGGDRHAAKQQLPDSAFAAAASDVGSSLADAVRRLDFLLGWLQQGLPPTPAMHETLRSLQFATQGAGLRILELGEAAERFAGSGVGKATVFRAAHQRGIVSVLSQGLTIAVAKVAQLNTLLDSAEKEAQARAARAGGQPPLTLHAEALLAPPAATAVPAPAGGRRPVVSLGAVASRRGSQDSVGSDGRASHAEGSGKGGEEAPTTADGVRRRRPPPPPAMPPMLQQAPPSSSQRHEQQASPSPQQAQATVVAPQATAALAEVTALESAMREVSSLVAVVAERLDAQSGDIASIAEAAATSNINVHAGVAQLRQANARPSLMRDLTVAVFLILTVALLLLDWFYR